MPYGLSAYHQVSASQVAALAARLGEAWEPPGARLESDWEYRERIVDPIAEQVAEPLATAHLDLIRTYFDPDAQFTPARVPVMSHVTAETPAGRREFRVFSLELSGDTINVGDPWPDGYILGVTLATRYHPTWMDWRDERGIFQFAPDDGAYQAAVAAIAAAVPELADGQCAVRLDFF